MACEVVVADEAKEDLEAAVLYLTESLGAPAAAGDLLDAFDGFVAKVEAFPLMYPTARESRLAHLGYRKAALEGYLALYRVKGEKVYVAHVFHQSQDYARLWGSGVRGARGRGGRGLAYILTIRTPFSPRLPSWREGPLAFMYAALRMHGWRRPCGHALAYWRRKASWKGQL